MGKPQDSAVPQPPSLMAALMAGFDATAAHASLILFPVVLDLLLWLGPRLRLTTLVNRLSDQVKDYGALQGPEAEQIVQTSQEMWAWIGEHFNLLLVLRSIPVGLPSLMSGRWPVETPAGQAAVFDITSGVALLVGVPLLILLGLVFGALYFRAVAEAALNGKVNWPQVLRQWPWDAGQTVLLGIFWHVLLVAISVPSMCFLSTLVMGGASLGRFGVMVYAGILLWTLFPLVLSTHGIFVHGNNVVTSVTRGVRMVRMTLPNTGMFIVMVLLISEGLEILWQVPEESSWFTLLGVFGHAFITTGLLAASFVYYRDADHWVQSMLEYWKQPPTAPTKV